MKEQKSTNNNVFYINSEFCAPEALLHLLTGKSVATGFQTVISLGISLKGDIILSQVEFKIRFETFWEVMCKVEDGVFHLTPSNVMLLLEISSLPESHST